MTKQIFKRKHYNVGILESYKPAEKVQTDSPVIGSFSVRGMAVENMVSQNRTKYSSEVWSQPTAFGKGGKFLDESGKLKPATLFGSVDHPTDDHAELLLQEAAIGWHDLKRNDDGSWDGSADILNNPLGRIVKTFLDYAKLRGGGDLLGVSSRALGESVLSESSDGQYEAIVPETFELMSFDFVYNPSFQTAVAHLNESKKHTSKNLLVESVKALAKEDGEHAEIYEQFAASLEKENEPVIMKYTMLEGKGIESAKQVYLKELMKEEVRLHDAIYELKQMTDEEFAKAQKSEQKLNRANLLAELKKEHAEVLAEIDKLENPQAAPVTEAVKTESAVDDILNDIESEESEDEPVEGEDKPEDEQSEDEPVEDESEEDEESEEDDEESEDEESEAEPTLADINKKVDELVDKVTEIIDMFGPVQDPELEIADMEDGVEPNPEPVLDEPNPQPDDEDESEDDEEDDEENIDLSEEELAELSDEELEYLANLEN